MKLSRNPIAQYCKQEVNQWIKLPIELCAVLPHEEEFTCAFISEEDGLHLMASVKPIEHVYCIHVSLSLLRTFKPNWSKEHHLGHLFDKSHQILNQFFPGRRFERVPDSPGINHVKHFISVLDE